MAELREQTPASALATGAYYTDNSGITVATASVKAEAPVSRRVTASVRVLVDDVSVQRTQIDPADLADPGAPGHHGGHPQHAPDVVTSASATAGGGAVAQKQRWEGLGRVELRDTHEHIPWQVWAVARASTEPDYGSRAAELGAGAELFQRNLAVSASLGYGADQVNPVEAPPGQSAMWPAEHDRVVASLAATQLLSRRATLSAGAALVHQHGQLANPYRRALVRTSLFPEKVPDSRDRVTGFVSLAWYLGLDSALHLRQGIYADTWDVVSWIPEAALAMGFGQNLLATYYYRYYRQSAAYFYRARYDNLDPLLSGDPRLGPIRSHVLGVDLRATPRGARFESGGLSLSAGYQIQTLDYLAYGTDLILAHTLSLSLSGWY